MRSSISRRVLGGGLILLALGLSACSASEPGPLVVPGNTPDSLAPDGGVVELSDTSLEPRVIEISEGGSVAWVNHDRTTHQLVSLAPNVFESPRLGEGESYVSTFPKPGTYPYYCTIHNEMKGTVVVYYAN
jgi:plastocyanin